MYKKIICLVIVVTVLSFPILSIAEVYISADEATRKLFPSLEHYETKQHIFEGQPFEVFTVYNGDKIMGWAVIADEMGKIKPITFLVGIDDKYRILGVFVLEYRDLFGSEIKRKSFLRQFIGKSIDDTLGIGKDIDAVTGATISSHAATEMVKKSLRIVETSQKQ
jgi:Na+-translocating ferredoxin:NAD+ oxidoreductase RnfG subunit